MRNWKFKRNMNRSEKGYGRRNKENRRNEGKECRSKGERILKIDYFEI